MKVIVIGGGPAGMLAAISSAQNENEVIILEKKDMLGKKLLITGKGRCNITSSLPIEDFIKNIPGNGMFMFSSFSNFNNIDIINLLSEEGVNVKVERGNRVFPVSNDSHDVLDALISKLTKLGVKVILNAKAEGILVKEQEIKTCVTNKENKADNNDVKIAYGVRVNINGRSNDMLADKIILATGGKSYPGTGSTGDGYKIAEEVGHNITKIRPSLVPLNVAKKSLRYCREMQGLSLKNVKIKISDKSKNKEIYNDFGEMLFTHFGVSGPIILSGSAHLLRYKGVDDVLQKNEIILSIDLKPALTEEKLDERILRDFAEEKNKEFKNSLDKLLPKKMIGIVVELSEISPNKKVNEITKVERKRIVHLLKNFEIYIDSFRNIEEAIITSGGIDIKQINPKTMESKLIKNLYFAGEIIDVDAYTGGFNLQIAYSTGYTAGRNKDK